MEINLEKAELMDFEHGRLLELSDYLAQLEPDEIAHQHWVEINRDAVRKAKFISGQGLVIESKL